jgi:hypothetical protein
MDHYTHLGMHDLTAALDRLPGLPSVGPKKDAPAVAATGTDGKPARSNLLKTCFASDDRGSLVRTDEDGKAKRTTRGASTQPITLKAFDDCSGGVRTGEEKEAPPGFEPGMADLQSTALPLG